MRNDDDWPEPSKLRPRGRRVCRHCRTSNLECERESNDVPCKNCTEGGLADSCLDVRIPPLLFPSNASPISRKQPSATARFLIFSFAWLYEHLRSFSAWLYEQLQNLIHSIPNLILPFLLFSPIYYASNAGSDHDTSQALRDFDQWVQHHTPPRSSSPLDPTNPATTPVDSQSTNASFISLVAIPGHGEDATDTTPSRYPFHGELISNRNSLPKSVQALHASWLAYVRSRVWEWRVLFALSGFLFTTAPSTFQIQGTSTDPLPRTLAYLSVFRALTGLLLTPLYLYNFGEQSHARSVEFAILWSRETYSHDGPAKWTPYILLSLPAATTLWSLLLYALSLLALIWRDSSPSAAGPAVITTSDIGSSLLRSLLTCVLIVDLVSGIWATRRMGRLRRQAGAMVSSYRGGGGGT